MQMPQVPFIPFLFKSLLQGGQTGACHGLPSFGDEIHSLNAPVYPPLLLTTFENNVSKGEMAHNEHYSFCYNVFNSVNLLYINLWIFLIGLPRRFKVVCCRYVVYGKGLNVATRPFQKKKSLQRKSDANTSIQFKLFITSLQLL